jgi:hypothetical protein
LEIDVEKIVPENRMISKNGYSVPEAFKYQTAFRWDFEFREQLCAKMKSIDKGINRSIGIRALTAEIINFIDGQRTISEIAEMIGYEYNLKIDPKHVLEFLLKVKEMGYINFKNGIS